MLLTAGPVEHVNFLDFLEDIVTNNPFDALTILTCGDILNFFPDIADEDHAKKSVLYEISPQMTLRGVQQLVETRTKHSLHESNLVRT